MVGGEVDWEAGGIHWRFFFLYFYFIVIIDPRSCIVAVAVFRGKKKRGKCQHNIRVVWAARRRHRVVVDLTVGGEKRTEDYNTENSGVHIKNTRRR